MFKSMFSNLMVISVTAFIVALQHAISILHLDVIAINIFVANLNPCIAITTKSGILYHKYQITQRINCLLPSGFWSPIRCIT